MNKSKKADNSNHDDISFNDKDDNDDDNDNNEGIPPLGIYTRALGKLEQNAAGATAVYEIFQMLGPMIFTPHADDEEFLPTNKEFTHLS